MVKQNVILSENSIPNIAEQTGYDVVDLRRLYFVMKLKRKKRFEGERCVFWLS